MMPAPGSDPSCSPPRERRDRAPSAAAAFSTALSTVLFLAALLVALPLRAHDLYTSFVEAKLLTDRLEVTLTLGRVNASPLLPDAATKRLPPLTPENFAAAEPRLRSAAPALLSISAAGKPLSFSAPAVVKLSGDSDVTFTLTYPRPTAGPLKFFAQFVGALVDGHTATVVLTNAAGDDFGWSPVSFDQPVFEVPLPAPTPAKKPVPKK
jgi:hypothetical protein